MKHKHWKRMFSDTLDEINGMDMDKGEATQALKLVHYSSRGNLKQIDPKFKGTGVDARTKGRDSSHPHSFFYRDGTEPERVVTSGAGHKYTTHLNESQQPIYDLGTDTHGFVQEAIKENQGVFNMDLVHKKLKDKGFHGFYNSNHDSLKNVVVMYHPMEVKEYAKL